MVTISQMHREATQLHVASRYLHKHPNIEWLLASYGGFFQYIPRNINLLAKCAVSITVDQVKILDANKLLVITYVKKSSDILNNSTSEKD